MDCVGVLHFDCHWLRHMGGAITDTKPHHFANFPAAGSIDCDRKGWLQQAASHSGNRIRQRRGLPLFRCPPSGISRLNVGGIKSALLRFQY